jgi:putative ABC transport system permease protein
MTRHLLRLMWNRKSRHALVIAELFFSFVVLFSISLLAITYFDNWRQPLGFRFENVWTVNVVPARLGTTSSIPLSAVYGQLMAAVHEFPNVETVAGANTSPYSGSNSRTGIAVSGRLILTAVGFVTDDFANVVDLRVTAGRWFSEEDNAAAIEPIVVTDRIAKAAWGNTNPVGQLVQDPENGTAPESYRSMRVIGVVQDYRKNGELATPENFVFRRVRLDRLTAAADPSRGGVDTTTPPSTLLLRVSPATTAAFEEALLRALQAAAKDWTFSVQQVSSLREARLREATAPLIWFGTIGGFLLLMVALGLTGVVWQSITERTREFGLRRAKGATARHIRRQVLWELTIVTSIALLLGLLLAAQLPLIPFPRLLPKPGVGVTLVSLATSMSSLYLLTLLCSWYPSRLATRIQPADALHYE